MADEPVTDPEQQQAPEVKTEETAGKKKDLNAKAAEVKDKAPAKPSRFLRSWFTRLTCLWIIVSALIYWFKPASTPTPSAPGASVTTTTVTVITDSTTTTTTDTSKVATPPGTTNTDNQTNTDQPGLFTKYIGTMSLFALCTLCYAYLLLMVYYINKKRELANSTYDVGEFTVIENIIKDMDNNILKYNVVASTALVTSAFILAIYGVFIFHLFNDIFDDVKKINTLQVHDPVVLVVLFLRTSLLGTFMISFLIYAYKFITSSFDQAVRFNKRKHATLIFLEVVKKQDLADRTVNRAMTAFKEWNVSVESAYTDSSFNSRNNKFMFDRMDKTDSMLMDIIRVLNIRR